MDKYVIAVKRGHRSKGLTDLADVVEDIEGLEIHRTAREDRLLVEASPEAIEEVRHRLGDTCHIERVIEHRLR